MHRVDRWLLIAGYVVLIATLAIATWANTNKVDHLEDQVRCLATHQVTEC